MTNAKSPVVLVTGASRGLGRGIGCHLAAQGFSVVVNFVRNLSAAEETVRLCEGKKLSSEQRFQAVQADISKREEREQLLQKSLAELGRIDGLVNNAGITPRVRADILEATEESFQELIQTNLQGPYFLTQAVARYWLTEKPEPLLEQGFKVVFVSSVSADTVSVNRGDYCISKAGLAMAAQLWSVRLADQGVQVFELRPGIMETDMTQGVHEKYDRLIADGVVPERRWGTPDDLGRTVASIMKGNLPFATGSVLYLDGGFHLRRL